MRSMKLLLMLLSTVLSMAPLTGCCHAGAQPVQPTVQVPTRCLSPKILASRPRPLDPTILCGPGISVVDCLAHEIELRDAYIARLVANCGGTP